MRYKQFDNEFFQMKKKIEMGQKNHNYDTIPVLRGEDGQLDGVQPNDFEN